jgi:hypothetical protein
VLLQGNHFSGCVLLQGNRRYIKCLYVFNKVDVCTIEEVDQVARQADSIPISCHMSLNLDGLLKKIWEMMALVRVYTKKVGAKPDFDLPVVLTNDRGGTTVEAFCRQIHNSLLKVRWVLAEPKLLVLAALSCRGLGGACCIRPGRHAGRLVPLLLACALL